MAIKLIPHSDAWRRKYELETARIRTALGSTATASHHIGSTAIPGILAKPVIDILVEATSVELVDDRSDCMKALGYEAKGTYGIPGRRYFRKDTPKGVREFHVHVFVVGSEEAEKHLAFRDYLRSHPEVAQEYSELKHGLAARHCADKSVYVVGKTSFIAKIVQDAIAWKRYV